MKFVRDKAHCKYESYTKEEIDKVSIIANKDLTEVIESSYFVLGEGVTDNYKNGTIPYVPITKGMTLLNTVNESTVNQNVNGENTKIEVYNVDQIIIKGTNLYYRSFQLLKSDKSLRENSMSPWSYKSLGYMPTFDDMPQEIYTDGGPVYAGYKIDGYKVYVARHSFEFGDSNTCDISADYVTSDTILVKFEGMQKSGYQLPLDYTYISDASKSFDGITIQCALDVVGQRIRLQAKSTGGKGYIDMYFYSEE